MQYFFLSFEETWLCNCKFGFLNYQYVGKVVVPCSSVLATDFRTARLLVGIPAEGNNANLPVTNLHKEINAKTCHSRWFYV